MDRSPHGLIATKLTPPAGPRHYVHRARLDRLLANGLSHKLTLVAAPAGFGKTALAACWLAATHPQAPAWLSLDASDNDPTRFWAYVIAALRGTGMTDLDDDPIEQSASEPAETALRSLVNSLARTNTTDVVLVLDDYHLVSDQRIHDGLAFLVNQLPPTAHLVVLTRADPPFMLSRWKANGDVVEIRARDLAFSRDETEVFLTDNDIHLPDELQDALFGRLSGWIAAMRLAAAWMAGRTDPSVAVAQFAASDSTIAAYLTSEILDQLPTDLRRFLLLTSVLPRLTGPLCDAVTHQTGGTETLRQLYDRDLFVDAVDGEHVWFRYHQLFSELLSHQLRREYPAMVDELHRRAAHWFAANGDVDDAIEHHLAASDWSGVRILMLVEAFSIGVRSRPNVVSSWLARIPDDVLDTPFFLMLRAFVGTHVGELDTARKQLARAMAILDDPAFVQPEPSLPGLKALIQVINAGISRLECDLLRVTAEANSVLEFLREADAVDTPLGRMSIAGATNSMLGTAYWHGELTGTFGSDSDVAPDMLRMRINRMSLESSALADAGRLREATAAASEVLELARGAGLTGTFQTNPAHLAAGLVSLQQADYGRALEQLTTVWERGRRHGDRAPATVAGVLLARLAALTGDASEALAFLDEAKTAWPGWIPPLTIAAGVAEEEARLCITVGEYAAARAVMDRLAQRSGNSARRDFTIRLTSARLNLAEGLDGSAKAFTDCAELALANDRVSRAVEAFVESAVASRVDGDVTVAQSTIERALALAEDESIIAPFAWHAAVVRPLLMSLEVSGAEVAMFGFRQRLLDAMGVPGRYTVAATASLSPVDALSDRELTVLRLLRGSLTNPEIAVALDISPNTLKTHVRHIYAKLGAESRQGAVARGKELALF